MASATKKASAPAVGVQPRRAAGVRTPAKPGGQMRPPATGLEDVDVGSPHAAVADTVDVRTRGDDEAEVAERLVADLDGGGDADVKSLCETYGLSRGQLGRLTGFSLRALAEWSTGKLPSEPARRRLHEVRRLLDALAELFPADVVSGWLGKRNKLFDNMTPLQVIEVGEIDRLWQMVYQLGSGYVD